MDGAFPGGVTDPDGGSFYVRLAGGTLVAVALVDGSVRWRREGAPRPLAAAPNYLLALDDRATRLAFLLLRASDGAELARVDAGADASAGDMLDARIDETPQGARIEWRAEPRYQGGAHPGILAGAGRRDRSGAFAVDARSGAVTLLDAAGRQPSADALLASVPAASAGARELPELRLKRGDAGDIILEARGPEGGLRWASPLGRAAPSRPAPLRP